MEIEDLEIDIDMGSIPGKKCFTYPIMSIEYYLPGTMIFASALININYVVPDKTLLMVCLTNGVIYIIDFVRDEEDLKKSEESKKK